MDPFELVIARTHQRRTLHRSYSETDNNGDYSDPFQDDRTFSPRTSRSDTSYESLDEDNATVTLPQCYERYLSARCVNDATSKNVSSADKTRTTTQKEEDLATALRWLRHEIMKIKMEDRTLMRQFLELRSIIQRCGMRASQGSSRKIRSASSSSCSSWGTNSSTSLDDVTEHRHNDTTAHQTTSTLASSMAQDNELVKFRPRTVSMLTQKVSLRYFSSQKD